MNFNTFYRACGLFALSVLALALTSCSPEGESDVLSEFPTITLPPIEVAEGDGLPAEFPEDLEWITNNDDPEFASPDAIQGGTFRTWILSFPLTLRTVGPDSNGSFAGFLRPIQFSPVTFHPMTRKPIPLMATHWAFGADGRSIYFRIHPDAKWSDGEPVTADDFVFTVQFMRSEQIVAPWYNNYYTERIRDVKKYDDHTYGVQGSHSKPGDELILDLGIGPTPDHFFRMSDNWPVEYNWKPAPTTGPYHVGEVEKGKYIELHRTEDWWADDLRYIRNRFNPDVIHIKVIRDETSAWQHFLSAEIDTYGLTRPNFWHDKTNAEAFRKGYINRYWFYTKLPVPSAGLYLNTADGRLADKNVRIGLAHAMNIELLMSTVLKGDYDRLPTFQLGFAHYDNTSIYPRNFDLAKANAHFEEAGFTEVGTDGIRVRTNEDGSKDRLSFEVTYGRDDHTPRLVVLKQEAKKSGVELRLDLQDSAASFKKMLEKKHQIAWLTWSTSGLSPRYWEHFHSVNAYEYDPEIDEMIVKTQTNNVTSTAIPEMDGLIMKYRNSSNLEERISLAHTLEQMVHDHAAVIPTYQVPYTRDAAWPWIELPEWLGVETTGSLFNSQANAAGMFSSGGLFWINEEKKEEILAARDRGETFDPVIIKDETYR
ncbi:MAG: extracellular solute-binding protein [Gammaproteobacteria bacterium]|nr:extracellular solute-binding protein [Gammaproteobacteria bacterium]